MNIVESEVLPTLVANKTKQPERSKHKIKTYQSQLLYQGFLERITLLDLNYWRAKIPKYSAGKADHTKEITEPNMTLDLLSWKSRSRVKTNLITDLIKLVTHLTRKEM